MGDDGSRWLKQRSTVSTVYGVLSRTCIFRDLALDFLKSHPGGQIVNLGCGLSHYFQWLDNGPAHMTDADLPDVIALRREFLGTPGERHTLAEKRSRRVSFFLAAYSRSEKRFCMIDGRRYECRYCLR